MSLDNKTSYFNSTRSFEDYLIDDKIYRSILMHPAIQRLKGISFLSTIPIVMNCREDFSRYDHLLGVSYLAHLSSQKLSLPDEYRKVPILAAMLHDIGHTPLSHAAETFLLENRHRYHEGLTTEYLRKIYLSMEGGSRQLLIQAHDLINGISNNPIMQSLFSGAICLDTLDGIARSSYSLFLDFVEPTDIIEAIYCEKGEAYFRFESLFLLDQFWICMTNLYSKFIYTNKVLSAEAMLTRALELTFGNNANGCLNLFAQLQDNEAWKMLLEDKSSAFLIQMIKGKKLFKSLSSIDRGFRNRIFSQYSSFRFDLTKRKEIENLVAKEYLVSSVYVILHYSFILMFRKKHPFDCNQLDLFDYSYGKDPPLIDVLASYTRARKSGARMEIFLPYHESSRQLEIDFGDKNAKA